MMAERHRYDTGRLTATLGKPASKKAGARGTQPLGLDKEKDGLMYVPQGYHSGQPAALAVMLHGAGGSAGQGLLLL
ncbi:hypothetical protein [Pontibacter liquoris]|uniref:hypothetical protein n=1 Tax=Pontibacter liquoris TaxID=2905677 RepID=UPI001FA6FE75|nr:hypothetical protein [Pontibacter liquoris]